MPMLTLTLSYTYHRDKAVTLPAEHMMGNLKSRIISVWCFQANLYPNPLWL